MKRGILGVEKGVEIVGGGGAQESTRLEEFGNGEGLTRMIFGVVLDLTRLHVQFVDSLNRFVN